MTTALHDPRHRLAHAAPGVGDQAAPLDVPARLRERSGEGVADREVAQMADVQRLGGVRVPELDREAPALRRGRPSAASALPPASSAAAGRVSIQPSVEPQPHLAASA